MTRVNIDTCHKKFGTLWDVWMEKCVSETEFLKYDKWKFWHVSQENYYSRAGLKQNFFQSDTCHLNIYRVSQVSIWTRGRAIFVQYATCLLWHVWKQILYNATRVTEFADSLTRVTWKFVRHDTCDTKCFVLWHERRKCSCCATGVFTNFVRYDTCTLWLLSP